MGDPAAAPSSLPRPSFFACYLLCSLNPRFKGRTYIGFTVNPKRRIRQHNGEITSGARKTQKRRPWEMILCVYGFPSHVHALQFEWAWQHPLRSIAVRDAASELKRRGARGQVLLLYTMLNLREWNSMNLIINFLSTKHRPLTKGCPSLPVQMQVRLGPLDDLPCYSFPYADLSASDGFESGSDDDQPSLQSTGIIPNSGALSARSSPPSSVDDQMEGTVGGRSSELDASPSQSSQDNDEDFPASQRNDENEDLSAPQSNDDDVISNILSRVSSLQQSPCRQKADDSFADMSPRMSASCFTPPPPDSAGEDIMLSDQRQKADDSFTDMSPRMSASCFTPPPPDSAGKDMMFSEQLHTSYQFSPLWSPSPAPIMHNDAAGCTQNADPLPFKLMDINCSSGLGSPLSPLSSIPVSKLNGPPPNGSPLSSIPASKLNGPSPKTGLLQARIGATSCNGLEIIDLTDSPALESHNKRDFIYV